MNSSNSQFKETIISENDTNNIYLLDFEWNLYWKY